LNKLASMMCIFFISQLKFVLIFHLGHKNQFFKPYNTNMNTKSAIFKHMGRILDSFNFILYMIFLWSVPVFTCLQIGSTVRASSMLRWFRSTCLHPVMTQWSSCAVHLPWSSLPVILTWTNWATGRANALSIRH